jgi:hypothetical protein
MAARKASAVESDALAVGGGEPKRTSETMKKIDIAAIETARRL